MAEAQQSAGAGTDGQPTSNNETARGRRRRLIGRVINDTSAPGRAQKTVVVEVVRHVRDPFYGKYTKTRKRFHAHDENHTCKTRDLVEIKACRPMSRTKRWIVIRLLERPPEV